MSRGEFSMDTGAIDEVASNVIIQANEYLNIIEATTKIVDGLSSHWEGESYDNFKNGYYSHLKTLEDLNTSLKDFAGELSEQAESTRRTAEKVESILGK